MKGCCTLTYEVFTQPSPSYGVDICYYFREYLDLFLFGIFFLFLFLANARFPATARFSALAIR